MNNIHAEKDENDPNTLREIDQDQVSYRII